MNRSEQDRYWFRAKRYGWGWGLPARREGWLVLAGYLVVVAGAAAAVGIVGDAAAGPALVVTVVASLALVVICARTGEPPSWRWGTRR